LDVAALVKLGYDSLGNKFFFAGSPDIGTYTSVTSPVPSELLASTLNNIACLCCTGKLYIFDDPLNTSPEGGIIPLRCNPPTLFLGTNLKKDFLLASLFGAPVLTKKRNSI